MSEIKYPDYNHCILNTITSILKHYNVPTNHKSLDNLDTILNKNYKNVVLLILDGMGEHILNNFSNNGFFKNHEIDCITSVFPTTTTAALTTYYAGKPPYETGWIAWSQYFKEYGRALDMLPQKESYQNDTLKNSTLNVFKEIVNYEPIFSRIENASPEIQAYEITPDYSEVRSKRSIRANNVEQICDNIKLLCSSEGKKFIMAYSDKPDALLHKFGFDSQEAKSMVLDAQKTIEDMCSNLKDTVIIISADHGHKEIAKKYNILDYPEILDCLIMPASLEPRTLTFWVKDNKKEEFVKLFNKEFSEDYILFTKNEFIEEKHMLGFGNKHKKIDDFIGDFVAVSTSDKVILLNNYLATKADEKKSTHCGLSKTEMEVPLIVIEN